MITLKKYTCREANDFDGSVLRSIAHWDVPSDGIYDLSQSCLVLPVTINTTETAGDDAQHNMSLKFRPVCLVKNCQLSSENAGIIEDLTHINFLNHNLNRFRYNTQDNEDNALFNGVNAVDEFNNNYSAFRDLVRTGTSSVAERRPELRVPLSDLFPGVGSFPQYPAMMMGRTTVRVEFQSGYNMLQEKRRYTNHTTSSVEFDDIAATVAKTTIVSEDNYQDAKEIPFWVGQKINVERKVDAAAATTVDTYITAIAWDATDATNPKKAVLTVAPEVATTAQAITDLTVIEVEAATMSYKIEQPKLLLYQVSPSPSQMNSAVSKLRSGTEMPFRTYTLEQDSVVNATAEYNRNFYLEPNCANAFLFGQLPAGAAGDNMNSTIVNLGSFRTSLNQVDLTSQDVVVNTPLYKDRNLWTISNSNMPLRNLRDSPTVVANPIPLTNVQQQYQVQLKKDAVGNIDPFNLHLYKQVQRVLKVSGRSVQVV